MWLEIGSGKKAKWLTIDAVKDADFVCVVPPLPHEIRSMKFDKVQAIHFWEHLYHWQAVQLASEIYDVLELGGKLILEMPNLIKCCEYVAGVHEIPASPRSPRIPDPRYTMWGIYGAQDDPPHVGDIHQAHKWGWTPASIKLLLKSAGFAMVDILPTQSKPGRDMRIEAYK